MCAGESSNLLAGGPKFVTDRSDSPADVSSSSALYRVLRGGRQRPSRSVDRETIGRNASEAIEPRQMLNRVWMPRRYLTCEGHAMIMVRPESRSTGVRVHGMWSKQIGKPRRSGCDGGNVKVLCRESVFKTALMSSPEVRWLHSSGEVE